MQEATLTSSVFDDIEKETPYFEYATVGQRFANYIIDMVVYYAFNFIIFAILGLTFSLFGYRETIIELANNKLFTLPIAYANLFIIYTLIEGASKGRTLGKVITGTQAVKNDLQKLNWDAAVIRSLCRLVPFDPLSALSGYPWHDKWSKTIVIKKRNRII